MKVTRTTEIHKSSEPSAIETATDRLDDLGTRLTGQVSDLKKRLGPVLRKVDDPSSRGEPDREETASPLEVQLEDLYSTFRHQSDRLVSILDRLRL